jgi:hypothetical protein
MAQISSLSLRNMGFENTVVRKNGPNKGETSKIGPYLSSQLKETLKRQKEWAEQGSTYRFLFWVRGMYSIRSLPPESTGRTKVSV